MKGTQRALLIVAAKRACRDGSALALCSRHGLSLNDLASSQGVGTTTAWRWLHGVSLPAGDRAAALGDLLNALAAETGPDEAA